MVFLAIWQQWDAFSIISLYWFEGVIIALFISCVLFLYEAKYLGGLMLLVQGFLYFIVGYLIFDGFSDIADPFESNAWLLALSGVFLFELFWFMKILLRYGKPFSDKLKGHSDPLVVRSVVRYTALMAYFVVVPLFGFRGVWSVIVFILLTALYEFRYLIQKKPFTD